MPGLSRAGGISFLEVSPGGSSDPTTHAGATHGLFGL